MFCQTSHLVPTTTYKEVFLLLLNSINVFPSFLSRKSPEPQKGAFLETSKRLTAEAFQRTRGLRSTPENSSGRRARGGQPHGRFPHFRRGAAGKVGAHLRATMPVRQTPLSLLESTSAIRCTHHTVRTSMSAMWSNDMRHLKPMGAVHPACLGC